MRKRNRQHEFRNMPERTPLGKKALEYINHRFEEVSLKEKMDKCRGELVELFQAAGKSSIKIENQVVSYSHVEKDSVKVQTASAG